MNKQYAEKVKRSEEFIDIICSLHIGSGENQACLGELINILKDNLLSQGLTPNLRNGCLAGKAIILELCPSESHFHYGVSDDFISKNRTFDPPGEFDLERAVGIMCNQISIYYRHEGAKKGAVTGANKLDKFIEKQGYYPPFSIEY